MGDYIDLARNIALDILKPSKRDLEYGLKLHKESIVCDSYGFGPFAALDKTMIRNMVDRGYSNQSVNDSAEKSKMAGFLYDDQEMEEYLRAWQASGVTCVFQNAGFESQTIKEILKRFAHYIYITDMMSHQVRKVVRPDDIVEAHKNGHSYLCLSCNAIPLLQDWKFVEDELSYIEYFFELGCRMMHFTYNRRNMFGDGCAEASDGGISNFGKSAIQEMNRVGMIIDVSHSGQLTSQQAAEISRVPIVASHSGAYEVNPHPRNKKDSVVKAIVDRCGVLGICGIPAFLGQSGDILALLDHIDYVVQKFGIDCVSIGTDRISHSKYTQEEVDKISPPQLDVKPFEFLWSKDEPLFLPKWNKSEQFLSLSWSNWPLFTVGLVQRGYSDDDVQKIIGGNILRVAKEVYAGRSQKR